MTRSMMMVLLFALRLNTLKVIVIHSMTLQSVRPSVCLSNAPMVHLMDTVTVEHQIGNCMQEAMLISMACQNSNKATAASDAFVRWLHHQYAPSNCHRNADIILLHDILSNCMTGAKMVSSVIAHWKFLKMYNFTNPFNVFQIHVNANSSK